MFYIQEFKSYNGNIKNILLVDQDNIWNISQEENNPTYLKYLEWIEQGNIAEPWMPEEV
jgi:hypothetical protein